MSIPSTVTQRAEGNDFVARTGMLLTGITGFAYKTGFYLTNSGNYEIQTFVKNVNQASYPDVIDLPSGDTYLLEPGTTKFIPFYFNFIGDNNNGGTSSGPSTGPFKNGSFYMPLSLQTSSLFNSDVDPNGYINVLITGQVTGFDVGSSRTNVHYPSDFKVQIKNGSDGRPSATLKWRHPVTGYYLTQYQIEKAIDITNSSSPTGVWSNLKTFTINNQTNTYYDSLSSDYAFCKQYGTRDGIRQLYSSEITDNVESVSGQYIDNDLDPSTNYYYRIKSQYIDKNDVTASESTYIYAYNVENFYGTISDTQTLYDVTNGLYSGTVSLSAATDPSTIINNPSPAPGAMYIEIPDNSVDVNLKTLFDNEISSANRNIDIADFNTYFTGVRFVVNEGSVIGTSTAGDFAAAIKYDTPILDNLSAEIPVTLMLQNNSKVIGAGGAGGNGGSLTITLSETYGNYYIADNRIRINSFRANPSARGGNGSAAIYIGSTISQFYIEMRSTALIAGGGGGGGGGDIYFIPGAFDAAVRQVNSSPNSTGGVARTTIYNTTAVHRNTAASNPSINYTIRAFDSYSRYTDYIKYTTFNDIIQPLYGGPGGGGQGYGKSLGGTYGVDESRFDESNGTLLAAGKSLNPNESQYTRLSVGGNGGLLGKYGGRGINVLGENMFVDVDHTDGDNDIDLFSTPIGGLPGSSIHVDTANTNYTRAKYLFHTPNDTVINTTNYPSLIAYFDADYNRYADEQGTIDCARGDINAWNTQYASDRIRIWNPTFTNYSTSDSKLKPYLEEVEVQRNNIGEFAQSNSYSYTNDVRKFEKITAIFPTSITSGAGHARGSHWNASSKISRNFNNGNAVAFGLTNGFNLKNVINNEFIKEGFSEDMESFEIIFWVSKKPLLTYSGTNRAAFNAVATTSKGGGTTYSYATNKLGVYDMFQQPQTLNKNAGMPASRDMIVSWKAGVRALGGLRYRLSDSALKLPRMPYTLHNWHPIYGPLASSSNFYKANQNNYSIVETMGLPKGFKFEFGGFSTSVRSFMYTVSATRRSSGITYTAYQDLNLIGSKRFSDLTSFNWPTDTPTIGSGFDGAVSDILIFKKSLSDEQRENVFNILRTKRRTPPSDIRRHTIQFHNVDDVANRYYVGNGVAKWFWFVSIPKAIYAGQFIRFYDEIYTRIQGTGPANLTRRNIGIGRVVKDIWETKTMGTLEDPYRNTDRNDYSRGLGGRVIYRIPIEFYGTVYSPWNDGGSYYTTQCQVLPSNTSLDNLYEMSPNLYGYVEGPATFYEPQTIN